MLDVSDKSLNSTTETNIVLYVNQLKFKLKIEKEKTFISSRITENELRVAGGEVGGGMC